MKRKEEEEEEKRREEEENRRRKKIKGMDMYGFYMETSLVWNSKDLYGFIWDLYGFLGFS